MTHIRTCARHALAVAFCLALLAPQASLASGQRGKPLTAPLPHPSLGQAALSAPLAAPPQVPASISVALAPGAAPASIAIVPSLARDVATLGKPETAAALIEGLADPRQSLAERLLFWDQFQLQLRDTIAQHGADPETAASLAGLLDGLSSHSRLPAEVAQGARDLNASWGAARFRQGQEEVSALERLVEDLSRRPRSYSQMLQDGLVLEDAQPVRRDGPESDVLPLKRVLLPAARTGMYVPLKLENPAAIDAVAAYFPGIGARYSQALSMANAGLTFFHGVEVQTDLGEKKTLRLMPYLVDNTLAGLGYGAPLYFGSPEGMTAVGRLATIVAKALLLEAKAASLRAKAERAIRKGGQDQAAAARTRAEAEARVSELTVKAFAVGRSQGGLAALQMASRHPDIAAVAAVNPSNTDHAVIQATSVPEMLKNLGVEVDPRIWAAYLHFTPLFDAMSQASLVPALLLMTPHDNNYPQPAQFDSYMSFVKAQPAMREALVFPNPPEAAQHNLLRRDSKFEAFYFTVIRHTARFFARQLWPEAFTRGDAIRIVPREH